MEQLLIQYLKPWLLPPGLNLLLFMLAILVSLTSRALARALLVFSTLLLWALSAPIVSYPLINKLQDLYPIIDVNQSAPENKQWIIAVLGGGDTYRAEYHHQHTVSDATFHRVEYGMYLQRYFKLPVLFSGGITRYLGESEAALMDKIAENYFAQKAQYLEERSYNTADEARYINDIMQKQHIEGVYLVTSAWHMPRSVEIFRHQGIKVIPAPMGHFSYGPGYNFLSFLPNMQALHVSSIAIHEYIGLLWYRLRY